MKTSFMSLLLLAGCVSSPAHVQAETQNVALTRKLATDYFAGKPVPPQSQQELVWQAIADVERRLGITPTPVVYPGDRK